MLGYKRIRKNCRKNSVAKKRVNRLKGIAFFFKTMSVAAALAVISFTFIFGYDVLTQCDYFRAEKLLVKGVHRLTEKQVLACAQIKTGINILSVSLSMARMNLLAHPWICAAEVTRELPDGITVRIKEHEALAVVDLGLKYLVNLDGEIFKELEPSDPDDLIIIDGLEYSDLNAPGKPKSEAFDAVISVLKLGQAQDSIFPNRLIKKIEVDREIGLTLHASGYEHGSVKKIKLGYKDYKSKYRVLEDVFFYLNKEKQYLDFDSIDLNNMDRIVVNPIKTKSSAIDHKEV